MKIIFPATIFVTLSAITGTLYGQSPVTGVFTDYHGFWSSSAASVSSVQPDSSHQLLAFTYNGTTFATGVSNAVLTDNAVAFQPAVFNSFTLANNSITPGTGTVIGVGNLYGGGSGNVLPLPVTNNLSQYLSDGVNGLDLGTAIFNVPSSKMNYNVSSLNTGSIGDNTPDIIVTQVGQPPAAGSLDTFSFENASGVVVGHPIAVSLSNISVVANGSWKFYDPGNPPTYNAGLQGLRPLRMVGFDLADFGITGANIGSVARFVHKLSGNSDQAFLAYNTASFNANTGVVLPVTLIDFTARKSGSSVHLAWKAGSARLFSHFELQRSAPDDKRFESIVSIPFREADAWQEYGYDDVNPANGLNYYRLKMVDQDGAAAYSTVQQISLSNDNSDVIIFPNPSTTRFSIRTTDVITAVTVYDLSGKAVHPLITGSGNSITIDAAKLSPGNYTIHLQAGNTTVVRKITKK